IDSDSKRKPVLDQVVDNFIGFWSKASKSMFDSSMITLEDQKYWALLDVEQNLNERKFTTGMHRVQHILVDEFQDINVLDLNLLKTIAALNKAELTIAGDDDQAIYEWRGATPEFMLEPDKHLSPGYHTCILETNYRSPQNIVVHSQLLIRHNVRRVKKTVEAHSNFKADIQVLSMPTLGTSVEYVLKTVRSILEGSEIKNVAIISRKRSQIIPYQIIFASENIPFYAAEDLQVFLSDAFIELKQILAIKARATVSPALIGVDVIEDLLRLCDKIKRFPIKKTDRSELKQFLTKERPKTLLAAIEAFYRYKGPLKGENTNGHMTKVFFEALDSLINAKTVSESIDSISQNFDGLQKDYGKSLDDIFYTDPPFLYLSDYAQRYGDDFASFYEDIEKAVATLAKIPPEHEEDMDPEPSWKL
ncbi:MAG: UvrD-helicase domain-containing protein, partial [Desulfomonilaceae bacterium]